MTLLLKSQAAPAFPKPPPVVSPAGIWSENSDASTPTGRGGWCAAEPGPASMAEAQAARRITITRELQFRICMADPSFIRERKNGSNVDGDVRRRAESALQFRRHLVVPGEPGFGAGAVAGGFRLEQFLRKLRHRGGHARVVDGVPPVHERQRPLLHQVVEFHHLRPPVRFARSKPPRARENADG